MNNIFSYLRLIMTLSFYCISTVIYAYSLDSKIIELDELKGYNVKFDYNGHHKQREIAYKCYMEKHPEAQNINLSEIGIGLYDLDNDGNEELFVYINAQDRCTRWGCPFYIFKYQDSITCKELIENRIISITVLLSSNLGFKNLLFHNGVDYINAVVFSWNGVTYQTAQIPIASNLGNDVIFDYCSVSLERDAAYKYFIEKFAEDKDEYPIYKSDIGIALHDIDGDGTKEIIAKFSPSKNITYYCDDIDGCPFVILKKLADNTYSPMAFDIGIYDENKANDIRVLNSKHLNRNDILKFNKFGGVPTSLWIWDGKSYIGSSFGPKP